MPDNQMRRLAWNSRDYVPYESCWAILVKIMVLNSISASEIYNLVKVAVKDSNTPSRSRRLSFKHWTSKGVDFKKFSELLNIDEDALRNGFLDQMGIVPERHDIWHCSECIKANYHCTLFNWRLVSHCPWHNIKLKKCEICSEAISFNTIGALIKTAIRHNVKYDGPGFALPCGHMQIDLHRDTSFHKNEVFPIGSIAETMRLTRAWIVSVLKNSYQIPVTIKLFHLGESYASRSEFQALFWKAFCEGGRPPFKSTIPLIPHDSIHWSADYTEESYFFGEDDPNFDNFEILFKGYRLVRRYIYKSFIRSHRRCYKRLVSMSSDKWQCVAHEKLCLVAVAFILWRMSIEGTSEPSFFIKNAAKTSFRIVVPSPQQGYDSCRRAITLRSAMNFWLGEFFGLWGSVEAHGLNPRTLVDRPWANLGRLKGDLIYFGERARYLFHHPFPNEILFRSVLYLSYISDRRCKCNEKFDDLFNGGRGATYVADRDDGYDFTEILEYVKLIQKKMGR